MAFGRAAFFAFGFRAGMLDSSAIGEGEGVDGIEGIEGISGSIMPGPVQPLSEKSVC